MSFKEEYKSAMSSVSPDTDKIMESVHERLNENAPIKIRVEPKKKPIFVYIGSFAGVAACLALCAVVLFNVVPNFVKMDGAAMENANGMYSPTGGESSFHCGFIGDNVANETENTIDATQSKNETAQEESNAEISGSIEFIGGDLATAKEVILNGVRYKNSGDTVRFSDKPENIRLVKSSDGTEFSFYLDGNRVYICKGEWKNPQIAYYFANK